MARSLLAAAVLAGLAPLAMAGTIIDFGTGPGQISGPIGPGQTIEFFVAPSSYTVQADTLTATGTSSDGFQVYGTTIRGTPLVPALDIGTGQFYMDFAFNGAPQFLGFSFSVTLYQNGGATGQYQFHPPFTVTALDPTIPTNGIPTRIFPTFGSTPALDGVAVDRVEIILFSGVNLVTPASYSLVIDEFGFEPIPEPTTMALLAVGGLAMLRRRR